MSIKHLCIAQSCLLILAGWYIIFLCTAIKFALLLGRFLPKLGDPTGVAVFLLGAELPCGRITFQ